MLSGYQRLYFDHVLQADRGVDLDFLVGQRRRRRAPRVALTGRLRGASPDR